MVKILLTLAVLFGLQSATVWKTAAERDFVVAPKGPATGFSGHRGFELHNTPLQAVRNVPEVINGRSFSGHALDQMQNRGIPLLVVEQALKGGTPFAGNRPGTQGFFDAVNKIRVIINSNTGNVITVIPGKP